MQTLDDAFRTVDDRFIRLRDEQRIPGVAWGVVRDGTLAHGGGAGTARDGEARTPDADTVFRIASMTKSFTAATVLLLRDEGRLRLDDPVALHVPAFGAPRVPGGDSGPVTLRHLLTMSAGLPMDDPWGDRQQALPLDAFARLLEAGPAFAWPPGTTFEYSNLGYGILGRAITAAAGAEYGTVVRDRLLAPLGMTSSAYHVEALDPERVAHGYVRRGDDLVREGTDGYGALAAMGGIFSTVRDLARWVAGFLDAFPARPDPEGPHPLRRASRREMQQVQRAIGAEVRAHAPDTEPTVFAGGYGLGLMVLSVPGLGTVVGHGGGYPGFGSTMVWHPASGLGIVALGNLRYASLSTDARELLGDLVRADVAPARRVRPSAAAERFRDTVEGLLAGWDDTVADASFAMNMDLDEPRDLRRAALERLAADLGPFRRDATRPAVSDSPFHLAWWLRGERGWIQAELILSPEPGPRIQGLRFVTAVDPSPGLVAAAERLLGAAGGPGRGWPDGLGRSEGLDAEAAARVLRAASARFGSLRLGLPVAGDGTATATWDLVTERGGGATLRLALDAATGALTEVALLAAAIRHPAEAW